MGPRSKIIFAAAAALLLAAGGLWWVFQSGPSADNRADVGTAQAFALADCKPRLFDGVPAVALMFTQPLARSQDWGKLIKANSTEASTPANKPVEPRWVLGDNPRVLYLPYVLPNRTFQVEMTEALAAAAGGTLGATQKCSVTSEAMPDAFYFASKGVVLPAGQNGGLPVVTVNTPEVDVQFLRVDGAALPAFLEQVGGRRERPANAGTPNFEEGEGAGDYYSSYEDNGRKLKGRVEGYQLDQLREKATSVYLGRFATDERKNRRNVNFLPVEKIKELQEPGVYIAVMNKPASFGSDYQVSYFYVTDIGLHVRRHAAQTDVFATSLRDGQAVGGVELTLIDEGGKTLAQTKTNGDGHGIFTGSTDKARAVLARRGKELSVLALREPALDLSEFDVGGHPSRSQKLFVYAGRDLYRPGEQFSVSVLARDADGKLLPMSQTGTATAVATPITLVLKKPDGEKVLTQIVRPGAIGSQYYQHKIEVAGNAPTGRWLLEARLDPASKKPDAQWSFQVEEFLPERMKLQLTVPEAVLQGKAAFSIGVQGDYLYGAPAAGNRLLSSLALERQRIALPQALPGFIFGDVDDDTARSRKDLAEEALDEQGKATIEVPLELAERKSPMKLRTSFSLLESGGRPVVRSVERTWWPAAALVGLRPLFERDVAQEGGLAEFELTRVNTAGKFTPAKELQIKLLREERRWYWRYDDQRGWNSGYTTEEELVEATTVPLAERKKIALPVTYGRYRLEITDPQTKQVSRYRFYAGWGAQDADDLGNRPDRVALKLEGAPFKAGDKAKLTITAPHDGEALVTVEGDKVLWQRRLRVRTSGTQIEIPVDAAWSRHDLYISVVAFRPGSAGDRITPARALGLVHLPLAREERKLKLAITAPAKSVPEQTVSVKVKLTDAAGNPVKTGNGKAIVTLSAVDVGILNITRYATPNPLDFFFGKHRYGADLLDIYGKLIEKMDGSLAKQRFGGDSAKRDTQSLPRKVRLVDLFSGPVLLNAAGEGIIQLVLPDFNGTLRLMAVASTDDSYASSDAEMTVAAPLVAELNMPRFISPGDSATIALDVTNLSGAQQDVTVQIDAGEPLRISGRPTAPVTLKDQQRTVLRYTLQAVDAFALAPIKITVTAGKIKVVREAFLQVQPVTALVREVRRIRIEPESTAKLDSTLADAYWAGSASINLSLSNKPPIDVRGAVRGLLMYPYGCLEQTTSSAYPLVFIDEAGARAFRIDPLSREERAKRLDYAFGRISGMQQQQGGFGLWAASNPYEGWLSAYVAGFFQDARDGGFNPPEAMFKKAMESLLEQFQKAPNTQTKPPKEMRRDAGGKLTDYRDIEVLRQAHLRLAESAHAGYILAREQKAPLATLRTLHDDYRSNARSPLVLIHLSLALKLMGDESRAKVALDEAIKLGYGIESSANSAYYNEWLGDYGSRIRDTALGYALLHRHKVVHPGRETLLLDLAGFFDQRQYYSTQERLALFLAARAAGGDAGQVWQALVQSGDKNEEIKSQGAEVRSYSAAELKRGIALVNRSKDVLFAEIAAEGYPVKPLLPQDDKISVERTLWGSDGKPVAGRDFKTGEVVVVRVRVNSRQRVKDALVVERVPAGMEVENLNLSQGIKASEFVVDGVNVGTALQDTRIKHSEYRDDRFVAAVDLNGSRLDLFYLLRVVTPGRYVVPAPFAEDMYRPDVRGVGKPEADITVSDPRAK
ncbi:MAG: alpha-2-macroglobulin family protein [Burkholderiaceae bacterium]